MRIAPYIATRGLASRRAAERLVAAGRVLLNNQSVIDCATKVDEGDIVSVDGVPLAACAPEPKLWLYHKPLGLVTTHHDPQGRPTVFERADVGERVISVGRLDINTSGLLLLTNSGTLARNMELPSSKISREYHVTIVGSVPIGLHPGPIICANGMRYLIDDVRVEGSRIAITLHEGRNHEVRNIMAHYGLKVAKLVRVRYGEFLLGALRPGELVQSPVPMT
jgi:23S rRNA pseudouridine2605 synthase